MKKKFAIAALALAMLTPAALAVSRDEAADVARQAAPGAELVRIERDDGMFEVELRGDGARYTVDVLAADGAVLEVETVRANAGRGATFALSEDEARAAAAAVAPEAVDGIVTRERGADGAAYEVFYAAGGAVGEVTVNAETGAIIADTRYPEAEQRGVLSAAELMRRVDERANGARIVDLELDWDGGRYLYEGEAEASGTRYDFEMDAASGTFVEFERDD